MSPPQEARDRAVELFRWHGTSLFDDPERLRTLLTEVPEPFATALVVAVRNGVARAVLAARSSLDLDDARAQLLQAFLADGNAGDERLAEWTIEVLAMAGHEPVAVLYGPAPPRLSLLERLVRRLRRPR